MKKKLLPLYREGANVSVEFNKMIADAEAGLVRGAGAGDSAGTHSLLQLRTSPPISSSGRVFFA